MGGHGRSRRSVLLRLALKCVLIVAILAAVAQDHHSVPQSGCPTLSFVAARNFSLGETESPGGAPGDFNGDGELDVLTTGVDNTSVLFGSGTGNLAKATSLSSPFHYNAIALAVADFNRDGKDDFARWDYEAGIRIFIGNGDGLFAQQPVLFPQGTPFARDVNSDGKADLVVIQGGAPSHVLVFLGAGDGTFGPVASYLAADFASGSSLVIGDFTSDGKLDLALCSGFGIVILPGDGLGGFGPLHQVITNGHVDAINSADFNGDGKLDIVALQGLGNAYIFLGDGSSGFTVVHFDLVGPHDDLVKVDIADFNTDGKLDLAGVDQESHSLLVMYGNGDGTFASPTRFAIGGTCALGIFGDFNDDGRLDVLTASNPNDVTIVIANGTGGFITARSYAIPTTVFNAGRATSVATADLNLDGKLDIVATESFGSNVVMFRGNGDGSFAPAVSVTGLLSVSCVVVSDVNNDGKPDLAVGGSVQGVSIMFGVGNGTFNVGPFVILPASVSTMVSADFNHDSKADLLVATSTNSLCVLLGDGTGQFTLANQISIGAVGSSMVMADFNSDGNQDVAVALPGIGIVGILLGNGSGSFTPASSVGPLDGPVGVSVGDVNLDGKTDLAVAIHDVPTVKVFLGNGAAGFGTPVTLPLGNQPSAVVIADLNGDGKLDLAATNEYSSNLTAFLGNGNGGFGLGRNFGVGRQPRSIASGDFNADGRQDLVTGNFQSGNITVIVGDSCASEIGRNLIDVSRVFVRQHYLDFLGREPDQTGWDYWTGQIAQCGSNALCIHNQRVNVSAAFYISNEFQLTGSVVYRIYRAAYGTWPGAASRVNMSFAQFSADRPLLIGGSGLDQNTIIYANNFVQRPTFVQAYPATLTNAQFVNQLFDTANLVPFTTERQQEIDAMNNSGRTRAQVLLNVINIQAFKDREYNPAFVLMQYFGYLRREVDQGGYDFWLNVVNNGVPNNYRAMVCAFITSTEYQLRFGTAITRSNQDCSP